MRLLTITFIIASFTAMQAQNTEEKLPYFEIPEYPESYTAGSVAARMVDGLGFRYYWATEGLRDEDLAFKANEEARTAAETIDHIYGLTKVIVNATLKQANERSKEQPELTFAEKRKQTLLNIKRAADILRKSKDLSEFNIVFKSSNGSSTEFPFWNNINGPIADALWHCGQVVMLRRSSGNPFNSKVSLLQGKLRGN